MVWRVGVELPVDDVGCARLIIGHGGNARPGDVVAVIADLT
jgi:hypothetical protein